MLSGHYVGYYDNDDILKVSSSGGIFSAIAEEILDKGGVVFGATFVATEREVRHIAIYEKSELYRIRKSKYVRSDYKLCFEELKRAINTNQYILFSGTPCQANVVRRLFGFYKKLYVCDLFCRGTADSDFFKEYLKIFKPYADSLDFRGQSESGSSNYRMKYYNNSFCISDENYGENLFTANWIWSSVLCESCFKCVYSPKRHIYSDITLGDYSFENPSVLVDRRILHPSIFAINTESGEKLLKDVSEKIKYYPLDSDIEIMHYYREHSKIKGKWGYNPEIRQKFLEDYKKDGFISASVRCAFPKETAVIEKVLSLKDKLSSLVIYGCGLSGRKLNNIIRNYFSVNVDMFLVSDKSDMPDIVDGIPVYSFNDKFEDIGNSVIIIAVSEKYRVEIENNLKKFNIRNYVLLDS